MYTFQTQYDGMTEWLTSSKRFVTYAEAAIAACDWMEVSYDNGIMTAIRVIKVGE